MGGIEKVGKADVPPLIIASAAGFIPLLTLHLGRLSACADCGNRQKNKQLTTNTSTTLSTGNKQLLLNLSSMGISLKTIKRFLIF
jgi:hypothetical protein